jgi:GDP-L-fucose synthase
VKATSRIFVAGSETLIGAALVERLQAEGCTELVGLAPHDPDLTRGEEVEEFFTAARPEYVFAAGGPSGGILENQRRPADLMRDNLLATTHLVDAAHRFRTAKLLYLASSCVYPRLAPQPMAESELLTGPPEPTSESYSLAKLAGLKLCQAYRRQYGARFIAGIPANPFGPGDDFDPETSHVIPALIRRIHSSLVNSEATCEVWGSGRPRRDFIYARDLADACLFVMHHYDGVDPINLGSGTGASVAEVAQVLAEVGGFQGRIRFDATKPDGAPAKCLDVSRLRQLGWRPPTPLRDALAETWDWYLRHVVCEKGEHARAAI